jgi:hypothetical protein
MSCRLGRFTVLAVGGLLLAGLLAASAQAAPPRRRPLGPVVPPNTPAMVNPNWTVAPGLTLNQYPYNLSVPGRAYSQVPPYAMGYNPYPAYANYGPTYSTLYRNSTPYPLYTPYGYTIYNPYYYVPYGAYYGY